MPYPQSTCVAHMPLTDKADKGGGGVTVQIVVMILMKNRWISDYITPFSLFSNELMSECRSHCEDLLI